MVIVPRHVRSDLLSSAEHRRLLFRPGTVIAYTRCMADKGLPGGITSRLKLPVVRDSKVVRHCLVLDPQEATRYPRPRGWNSARIASP